MVEGTRTCSRLAKEGGAERFVHMSALGTSEETKDLVPYYGAKWAAWSRTSRARASRT